MDSNLGGSFLLSFLLVGVAAVTLHRPGASFAQAHRAPLDPKSVDQPAPATDSPPPVTSGVPLTEAEASPAPAVLPPSAPASQPVASAPPAGRTSRPVVTVGEHPRPVPPIHPVRGVRPGSGSASGSTGTARLVRSTADTVPRRPRTRFTQVAPGESLADVAVRIYGTTEAASALWRANRDQLDDPDAPLAAGTLLRTP